jgi:hypothetical protein
LEEKRGKREREKEIVKEREIGKYRKRERKRERCK